MASFATGAEIPGDLLRRLNGITASDVAVTAVTPAPAGFDARNDATSRSYRYRLLTRRPSGPFEQGRALWWPHRVDRKGLDACAAVLLGRHDFTAFTPSQTDHVYFEREILAAAWEDHPGEILAFRVTADAFMRSMVRILVGTMLEVASSRRTVESFARASGRRLAPGGRGNRAAARPLSGVRLLRLESALVRILLTNDDGISAPGLQALRRALRELDDVEVDVIAPDSNRSATARSITTRSPLSIEEVEFGDGHRGYATDGTPVDCVRFAELGLVGGRPDLIVSGINHGANLGDDITYSGTVAAALEGIVLGIPAVAFSQQSSAGGMGYVSGRFDFAVAAAFAAQLVARLAGERMPEATLINVNCPAGEPSGVEVTRLGKRIYNDELKLVGEEAEGARKRYEIYGWQPGYEEIEGTDLHAVARGRISVTPIHFDLTDHGGLERLRGWGFEEMLAASAPAA